MEIKTIPVTVRELVAGYENNAEAGVVGYDGKLDIRPQYQREFVYKDEQRDAVIDTVKRGLPLNVMYWAVVDGEEEKYEVLDGQQRTISLCEYVAGSYSIDGTYFYNLPSDVKDTILDYPLHVYICSGTDSQKLDWFQIINTSGEELTEQELLNAVYAGPWVSDAKHHFSRSQSSAERKGGKYLSGSSIRQEYLETVLKWAAEAEDVSIAEYMGKRQHKKDALDLWVYFQRVIDWVETVFPTFRKEMKGLPWGLYYNLHHERTDLDPKELETEIERLMDDVDVTKPKGIYEYLLTGREKALNIRSFNARDRKEQYSAQGKKCNICQKEFPMNKMHADHIVPWSEGGKTVASNCQMLCTTCNIAKGAN